MKKAVSVILCAAFSLAAFAGCTHEVEEEVDKEVEKEATVSAYSQVWRSSEEDVKHDVGDLSIDSGWGAVPQVDKAGVLCEVETQTLYKTAYTAAARLLVNDLSTTNNPVKDVACVLRVLDGKGVELGRRNVRIAEFDEKLTYNHTCDCAYGDFCISQVAKLEGDKEEAEKLFDRSKNYKNLFDAESGFLRGKDEKGNMKGSFDPFDWGGDYCEGSAWQNSFAVYHDVEGLAALYGGPDKLCAKLDELFSAEPVFGIGGYGEEIHEMSEMASVDFGQCAVSNQPSFHLPWLYAALGDREKTEFWVEKLVCEAFNSETDGFPGDEDNGTMAAWYVFACLGFYPLCPGKAEFVAAKPLFEKITLNGKQIKRFSDDIVSFDKI